MSVIALVGYSCCQRIPWFAEWLLGSGEGKRCLLIYFAFVVHPRIGEEGGAAETVRRQQADPHEAAHVARPQGKVLDSAILLCQHCVMAKAEESAGDGGARLALGEDSGCQGEEREIKGEGGNKAVWKMTLNAFYIHNALSNSSPGCLPDTRSKSSFVSFSRGSLQTADFHPSMGLCVASCALLEGQRFFSSCLASQTP